MRCVSAVLVVVLLSYGACEAPTNTTEGECEVTGTTAICGEVFKWPEDLRITKVVVRSTKLERIEKHDLAKYENLETLDLSNSGLHHIDSDAFTSNAKLTELILSGNKNLQFPAEEPFIASKTLTHLNLSHTTIEDLPENSFKDLPNLQVIDLTATNITDFSSLSNLEHLHTIIIAENINLNKTSLCHETHLKQITEISNDKRTTFNCPETTNEDIHTTEPEPSTTKLPIISQTTEKVEHKEAEPEVEPETIPLNNETITVPIAETNTSAPENDQPENIIELKIVTPETKNTTEAPETSKAAEESKNNEETKEEKEIKVEEPIPETETKTGATETPTEKATENLTENTTTNTEVIDSLIKFNTVSPAPKKENIESVDGQDTAQVNASQPQPAPAESNGVNIVLGIILCVMIVGGVGFGYKYLKNRRGGYSNANTEDVEEGKELQNMVSHRATNGEPEQN